MVADMFCGPMKRLPTGGQLLTVEDIPAMAGGCAANVAIDLAKQGIAVEVAGCLGRDSAAKVLLSCLEANGVGCGRLLQTDRHPTSQTVILLVEGEDRRYIHAFGANRDFTVAHVDRKWVAGLKVFYLGGLFAMPAVRTGALGELLKFCRKNGVTTVVDVVVPERMRGMSEIKPLLPWIDYFVPNDDEARLFTGCPDPLDQVRAFQACGASTVVITRGKKGAIAARGSRYWTSGIYPVKVKDPSGSGDAFCSGIITGIVREWELPQTLRYASALGASAARAVGTTTGVFTARTARSFIAAHPLKMAAGSLRK
jgi:sugar/nucleoside kinase (ribokinase family)